jgi:hypothetical protein
MTEIAIRLSSLPVYECGATLFTYLAFPEPGMDDRRAEAHAALCHLALRAMVQDDPAALWTPQLVKLGYALHTENQARLAAKTIDRRPAQPA